MAKKDNFATISPVVSSITGWVDANVEQLIAKILLGNSTPSNVQTGVVGKTKLNILDTTVVFNDGSSCGFNATSGTTISQREIDPGVYAVNAAYCPKQLIGTYAQHLVKVAAGKENLPFEEKFVADLVANINLEADKALWRGDKANGQGNLALSDGWLTILNAANSGAIKFNAATETTKIAQITKTIEKIPAAAFKAGVVRIYVSPEYATSLALELVAANLYHFNPGTEVGPIKEIRFPGTNVVITAVDGLGDQTGDTYIVAGPEKYFVKGVDAEGDQDTLKIWWSDDDQLLKVKAEFVLGAQNAVPSYAVVTKVA